MLILTKLTKRDYPRWIRNIAKYRRWMEKSFIIYVKCFGVRDWWKQLNFMNLTYFRSKMRANVENKNNNPVNVRFVVKTSNIRNLSENIICLVVCLRGGKRGTCLSPPLRCYAHKFSLFLVKNLLSAHIVCYKADHKQVLCFQRSPYKSFSVQVRCFQRVPQQQLQFEGNLLSKRPQTATKMWKYFSFKLHWRGL